MLNNMLRNDLYTYMSYIYAKEKETSHITASFINIRIVKSQNVSPKRLISV